MKERTDALPGSILYIQEVQETIDLDQFGSDGRAAHGVSPRHRIQALRLIFRLGGDRYRFLNFCAA